MIQLKLRSEYSFGLTYAPVKKMIARLKEMGCTAAGLVDNNTWGHYEWFTECKAAGIQPLLGAECAVSDEDVPLRMWFLARNATGLSELYRALSKAHQQPISLRSGKVPRLTRGDVRRMSGDILKFAGDVTDGDFLAEADAFVDLAPGSAVLNSLKKRLAGHHGLQIVQTSDNAYIDEADRDILPLISRATLKPTPQHILPGLDGEWEQRIAEMCKELTMPSAPMISAEGDLLAMCRAGIAARRMEWNDEYEERLLYELELIRSKNFDSYFIVVADMCRFAKQHMLVGPSRGSAAGSLVCYVLGITEIDPIPPKLYFERFIDITRSDLPDIDLDFPDSKRQMVFDYMAEKYGAEKTAHIGTVSRFKPKSALIEVCKAMGIPASATAAVKASIIERGAADSRASNCLEDTLKETGPGREFARDYPEALVAAEIEGHASHTGVHAAGLLVCNDSITNYCVVDANGIAHIEKGAAEKLGLLKIDVLGLRTLSVLEDSGVPIDWYGMKFDDPKVFDVFNEGRLCGIFQFEGNALRSISERIKFSHLLHVDAVTALARPGPFGGGVTGEYMERFNGKPYKAIHPLVEKQMAETYGLPVYQEQTLAIVREIGQFDWKDTSFIRKAMSKRLGTEVFEAYWQKFRQGAVNQGIDEIAARKTWDMINSMGAWQMNKCLAEGSLVRIAANNTGLPLWCPIEKIYEKYVENKSPWVRQNKSMPRLMSLFPDGFGRPQTAKTIHKNGLKHCVELLFDDGTKTRCTPDHKFIINGEWQQCGKAQPGDEFTSLERKKVFYEKRGNPAKGKTWNIEGNNRSGANNIGYVNGLTKAKNEYKRLRAADPCERCGEFKVRMEVHHNDLNEGRDRPTDLAWLCSGCHKRVHHLAGDRGKPYDAGFVKNSKMLVSMLDVGELMTYDIEMPEHHNYVIDGGIVTHNSHTWSYAVISYWTAYLKAHHPLEFAAATLRNAKDEDSALMLLREMVKEGIEFEAFNEKYSQLNWSIRDGKLIGGFLNLHGFGAVNSAKFIADRDAGRLTPKQIEKMRNARNIFADIYPLRTKYKAYYEGAMPVNGGVHTIDEFNGTQDGSYAFIGEIVYKNPRRADEEVNLKKRGGRMLSGPQEFLDLRVRDDTETLLVRIDRYDYQSMGKYIAENIKVGSHLLLRCSFGKGFRFGKVQNYRVLEAA